MMRAIDGVCTTATPITSPTLPVPIAVIMTSMKISGGNDSRMSINRIRSESARFRL